MLSRLLTHNDPRFEIFYQWALDLDILEFQNLVFDLCQMVPDMVFTPFIMTTDEQTPPSNLLSVFKKNPQEFSTILMWLARKLPASKFGDDKIFLILEIQSELIALIHREDKSGYATRLQGLPLPRVYEVINQTNDALIDALLSAPLYFLKVLIKLDASILQVKFDDDRILDILCEDPDFNDSVLTMTLNTHGDTLSIEDKLLITTALQPAAQRDETARFDQPKVNCQKKSSMPGFLNYYLKSQKIYYKNCYLMQLN